MRETVLPKSAALVQMSRQIVREGSLQPAEFCVGHVLVLCTLNPLNINHTNCQQKGDDCEVATVTELATVTERRNTEKYKIFEGQTLR